MEHLLDNPIWHALSGPQKEFSVGTGAARHYRRDISPFSAVPELSPEVYADMASDYRDVGIIRLIRDPIDSLPDDWERIDGYLLIQMICEDIPKLPAAPKLEVRRIEPSDVNAVLDLVNIAKPGPFEVNTIKVGTYWGCWENGKLMALAGERFRLPGFVEVSGVCTAPDARGRGLATYLICLLMKNMQANGEVPFLHLKGSNDALVKLYSGMGFKVRKHLQSTWLRPRVA